MPDGVDRDGTATLTMSLHTAIKEIDRADWDACAGDGNPFVSHAFLSVVEDSGSANARTGWVPRHAVLRDDSGTVVAVAIFGEAGRHARTTIGVPSLPADAAVEVEGMFEVE